MSKSEIIETRKVGFGSSDAKMVASVGKIGQLNETAKKRIAEMLGLKDRDDVTAYAMELGNEFEQAVFDSIKSVVPEAVSNPFYKHEELSERFGFGVFNHIDIEVENDKRVIWYECKSTIKTAESALDEYRYHLAWHFMLLANKANGRKFALVLTHYDTSDGNTTFNTNNLHSIQLNYDEFTAYIDEIIAGLEVISKSLVDFTYKPEVTTDGENLPAQTRSILPKISHLLRVAKEAEERAEQFKQELKEAMEANGIKTIDNEYFKATYVPEGVQARFDSKTMQKDEPELYKKYLKNASVKSQIRLTLK